MKNWLNLLLQQDNCTTMAITEFCLEVGSVYLTTFHFITKCSRELKGKHQLLLKNGWQNYGTELKKLKHQNKLNKLLTH